MVSFLAMLHDWTLGQNGTVQLYIKCEMSSRMTPLWKGTHGHYTDCSSQVEWQEEAETDSQLHPNADSHSGLGDVFRIWVCWFISTLLFGNRDNRGGKLLKYMPVGFPPVMGASLNPSWGFWIFKSNYIYYIETASAYPDWGSPLATHSESGYAEL